MDVDNNALDLADETAVVHEWANHDASDEWIDHEALCEAPASPLYFPSSSDDEAMDGQSFSRQFRCQGPPGQC